MDIEQAKVIHSSVMSVLMHTKCIGEFSDADLLKVKETSLSDIILANNMMGNHKEFNEDGTLLFFTVTTDKSLAELYIRIHDDQFMDTSEFEDICNAMNDAFEGTINGHGVLVDGSGYYSLIELSSSGDCAEKTLVVVGTSREIYDYAKKCIKESGPDE